MCHLACGARRQFESAKRRRTHAICYSSATDEPIPNLGEQKLPMITQEGSLRMMTCQVATVVRPLGSVKRNKNQERAPDLPYQV